MRQSPTVRLNETAPPATPAPPPPLPPDTTPALVVSVVDGDTINVLIDGQEYAVRYIGIDTPESGDPRRAEECFGQEASARNEELVGGRTVGLEKDVSETDQFGRLLRYVWLDTSEMVNATLVRDGYAESISYPPDLRHQELLDQLETTARANGHGLWGPECAETPTVLAGGQPVAGGETCDYSGTSEPVIKGNISQNTGERIYHVPGQENYGPTRINEGAGERWFCTESEAVSAGWRKSLR
ncbi:MAG TPA: thermonuclease family protein [Dehalococcoidia bacterium]|nr:thermonuclease family protein [Dehalococcoidia bacterium]